MPITNREEARESGFAQVREALVSFEGTVVSAEFGQWGGKLIDEDTGKPVPPREFLEIECVDVEVLEVTEELAMPVDEWNFRVNCSDFKGSFWVEDFLLSTGKAKLLIPDDLVGKRIVWKKVTREAFDKSGTRTPKFDATNFIISSVKAVAKANPKVVTPPKVPTDQSQENSPTDGDDQTDLMEIALKLAIGKTETQFRSALSLSPDFVDSPFLALAKSGLLSQSFVKEGKLIEVKEGTKTVYRKPE